MKLLRLQKIEEFNYIQFDSSLNWLLIPIYNWITDRADLIKETHLQKPPSGSYFLLLVFKVENEKNSRALYNSLQDKIHFSQKAKRKVNFLAQKFKQ